VLRNRRSPTELLGVNAYVFCGNTRTRRNLALRSRSALMLICGNTVRDPDSQDHYGVVSPDASPGCGSSCCRRHRGRQYQRHDSGDDREGSG